VSRLYLHAAAVWVAMLCASADAGGRSEEAQQVSGSGAPLDLAIRTLDRLAAVSVSMHAADVTVEQVMRMLFDMTGVPVVMDPASKDESVSGANVTIRAEEASALSILNQLMVALPSDAAESGAFSFFAVDDRIVLMNVGMMHRRSAARYEFLYPWAAFGPEVFAAAQAAGADEDPEAMLDALRETDISRVGLDQMCRLLGDLAMLGEWRPPSVGLYPSYDFLKGGLRINAPAHVHRGFRKLVRIGDAAGPPRIGIRCAVVELPRGAMHVPAIGSGISGVSVAAIRQLGASQWTAEGDVAEGGVYRAQVRLDDQMQLNLTMSPEAPDGEGRRVVPLFVTAEGSDASLLYEVQAVMSGRNLLIVLEVPARHDGAAEADHADVVRLLTISVTVRDA